MASLQSLKESLEQMGFPQQVEALRIIQDKGAGDISENSNGTFVNLTCQPESLIIALRKYVKYVDDQQKTLRCVEQEKERLQEEYFNGNKDIGTESAEADV